MMGAVAMDFTLSNTMIASIVRPVEYFQRPPSMAQIWSMSPPFSDNFGETYLLTVDSGRLSSLSATTKTMIASSSRDSIELSIEMERQHIIRKLVENSSDPMVAEDVDAISETVERSYELLSRWGVGAFDMHRLFNATNPIHLAAILRVTADVKEFNSCWDDLLEYTVDLSRRSGVEPEDALFGLI